MFVLSLSFDCPVIGDVHGGDSIAGMDCRPGCGACCTAPSITSPIPGMPQGKPAGMPCVQLDPRQGCRLFGRAERPAVCVSLQPQAEMCGRSREQAMAWLDALERQTTPQREPATT